MRRLRNFLLQYVATGILILPEILSVIFCATPAQGKLPTADDIYSMRKCPN